MHMTLFEAKECKIDLCEMENVDFLKIHIFIVSWMIKMKKERVMQVIQEYWSLFRRVDI